MDNMKGIKSLKEALNQEAQVKLGDFDKRTDLSISTYATENSILDECLKNLNLRNCDIENRVSSIQYQLVTANRPPVTSDQKPEARNHFLRLFIECPGFHIHICDPLFALFRCDGFQGSIRILDDDPTFNQHFIATLTNFFIGMTDELAVTAG